MTSPSLLAESFNAVLRDRARDTLIVAPSEGHMLTADDIDLQARSLATEFGRCHLAAGHLVVACIGNVAAMPALVLASLRMGLPLMPVDRSTPAGELRALASRWAAAIVSRWRAAP